MYITCTFHICCTHALWIIDMHRGVCDVQNGPGELEKFGWTWISKASCVPPMSVSPIHSLVPSKCSNNLKSAIFEQFMDRYLEYSCEIAPRWVLQNSINVNIGSSNGWCRQATSHYLHQCSLRSLSPWWVKVNLYKLNNCVKLCWMNYFGQTSVINVSV